MVPEERIANVGMANSFIGRNVYAGGNHYQTVEELKKCNQMSIEVNLVKNSS